MKNLLILVFLAVLIVSLVACEALLPTPLMDYGDAPDPDFPSFRASDGARVEAVTFFWLGDPDRIPTVEIDSKQVDKDERDDGLEEIAFGDGTIILTFRAVNSERARVVVFFNLLADLNADGKWSSDEHVVDNWQVDLAPGESETIVVEFELPEVRQFWIRAMLTDAPSFGSTGTGKFDEGEVEDYLLKLEPTTGIAPEPTPTQPTEIMPPVPERTFTDPSEDTVICGTAESAILPAADIGGINVMPTEGGMRVEVGLVRRPDESLETQFSWAVLLEKQEQDGTWHIYLLEVHAGERMQGEKNAMGEIISGTEGFVSTDGNNVIFNVPQNIQDVAIVQVRSFNLPTEQDAVGCDFAGPFDVSGQAQPPMEEQPQVSAIEGGFEHRNGDTKVFFNVWALPSRYIICGSIIRPDGEVRSGCVTDEGGNGQVTFGHITMLPGLYEFEVTKLNDRTDFLGPREASVEFTLPCGGQC